MAHLAETPKKTASTLETEEAAVTALILSTLMVFDDNVFENDGALRSFGLHESVEMSDSAQCPSIAPDRFPQLA